MSGRLDKKDFIYTLVFGIVHGLLLLLALLVFIFVVPVFAEMFADFGVSLPVLTQVTLNLSRLFGELGILLLPGLAVILGADMGLYCLLRLSVGRKAGVTWLCVFTLILLAVTIITVGSLFFVTTGMTEALAA